MREEKKVRVLCLIVVLFLIGTSIANAVNIKFIKKLEITSRAEESRVQIPRSFCITNDGLFILCDYSDGNLKIYEQNGESLRWIKNVGQKGMGETDFLKPAFCFFDSEKQMLGVLDYGKYRIFLLERTGRLNFKIINQVFVPRLGSSIKMNENNIIIAGTTIDSRNNSYELYSIDLKKKNSENIFSTTYLIPAYKKYGLRNSDDFNDDYIERSDLGTIGINGFFDIHGKDIYYVWEGDLRILKFNTETEALSVFGIKHRNYVKPYISTYSASARHNGDVQMIRTERSTMSYVRNVFVTSKCVLVIIEGPNKMRKDMIESNFWMQAYNFDGSLINETLIPLNPGLRMFFDNTSGKLYSLINMDNDPSKREYSILVYKIME